MLLGMEKFSLPELEEKILVFWHKNKIFEKSLKKTEKNKKFIFYEGPPTANGQPGIHHILARAFKDVILRYKTMTGFSVPRKGGWDTHGLPVEIEVEKELGLRSKKEIEEYGIAKFNQRCRESVWKYKDEWEKLTERIGFWLDMKHPYITYENSYIETLWWIIKQIWNKKLLYKGHKVVPWCTRCGTVLSSHELALGYKEVVENSVYLKFRLRAGQKIGKFVTDKKTYILSWTTTPWTLPGNVALAVGKKIDYVLVKNEDEKFLLSKVLINQVFGQTREIVQGFKGEALVGLEYEPLFKIAALKSKASYRIYPADFVTTTDGTGVVHTAMMYGIDDYQLGKKIGLPEHHTVDERGRFTDDVPDFSGLYVKAKETEAKILERLRINGSLLQIKEYAHEYPFCWRCGEPLLYYARSSWFVAMSKLQSRLLIENKKINWVPEHLKFGRFGGWLKEVQDWAFSRDRYWGTPLPIWVCGDCGHEEVLGSREDFSKLAPSKNKYIVLRHGEAMSNFKHLVNSDPKNKDKFSLTLKGRAQIEQTVKKLKKEKIDLIFSSDFKRAKETAEIAANILGGLKVCIDARLREIHAGDLEGHASDDYGIFFHSYEEKFLKAPLGGETAKDVARRVCDFINEIERTHSGKNILIVSHEHAIWMLQSVMSGWSSGEAIKHKEAAGEDFIETGEVREISYLTLPRDETGFGDFHKPYIDKIYFNCPKCRKQMKRVSEVIDVWFDSGAMPFAQAHYPFEKGEKLDFPADYISEAMDQTRGWFYTLLAEAVLLDKTCPFKNVISLGLVLDKNGQKMSKSKGNVVDPKTMIQKYGADVIRWYFYTINQPGESKNFDEVDLGKTLRQFVLMIYNSFVFWNTYADKNILKAKNHKLKTNNVLDKWLFARLNETILIASSSFEKYDVNTAARSIDFFVQDLSRWYIRRSRRRFQPARRSFDGGGKSEEQSDYLAASQTLSVALETLSKLLAPFMPFFSEALYKSFASGQKLSVHLEDWPKANKKMINKELLVNMSEIRRIANLVLAKRAELGIKVRQPLAELTLKNIALKNEKELIEVLKEEVNVKKVVFEKNQKTEIKLDTNITHELKEEGWLREIVRIIQDLRQDAKLEPKNEIILVMALPQELHFIVEKNEKFLKKEVSAKLIEYKRTDKFDIELETKLENWPIWLGLRKPRG